METFENLVARKTAEYRAALTANPAKRSVVPSPTFPAETHDRFAVFESRMFNWTFIPAIGGILGSIAVAGIAAVTPIPEAVALIPAAGVAMLPVGPAIIGLRSLRAFGRAKRLHDVPADISLAYTDYWHAEARLRDLDANLDVIGQVQDQRPYIEDLIRQVINLTNQNALDGETGRAVRAEILRIGAEAAALVELDRHRHATAVEAADARDVLARAPRALDAAAEVITGETERVEQVLSARAN